MKWMTLFIIQVCILIISISFFFNIGEVRADTIIIDDDGGAWADHTSIQDALDNATAGDTILVYNGTYENSIVQKEVYLYGNGSTETICDINDSDSGFFVEANNVVIDGFSITNVRCCGSYVAGIRVNGFNNAFIANCTIYDGRMNGILIDGDYNEVHNCHINDTTGSPLHLLGNWNFVENCIMIEHSSQVLIEGENVTLSNISISKIDNNGLDVKNSKRIMIDNLTINDTRYRGISITNSERVRISSSEFGRVPIVPSWTDCLLITGSSNCTFTNLSTQGGIRIIGTDLWQFNTHTLSSVLDRGKEIEYITNSSGLKRDSSSRPIILVNSMDIEISRCNISNVGYGIQLGFCSNISINRSLLENIQFRGMIMSYSDHIMVNGSLLNNTGTGIELFKSDFNTLANIEVNGANNGIRLCESNSNDLINISFQQCNWSGIVLDRSKTNDISALNVSIDGGGIWLIHYSDRNTFQYINISDSKGISITSGDNNDFRDIFIRNATRSGIFIDDSYNSFTNFSISWCLETGIRINSGYRNTFTNGSVLNNSNQGMFVGDYCQNTNINNVDLKGNGYRGIYLSKYNYYSEIRNCSIDYNDQGGIYLHNGPQYSDISFDNLTLDSNNGTGIDLVSGVGDMIIKNCYLTNNTEYGIHLDGGRNCLIENCMIYDSGLQGLLMEGPFSVVNTIRNCRIRNNNMNDSILLDESEWISIIDCDLREGLYITGNVNNGHYLGHFDSHMIENVSVRGIPITYIANCTNLYLTGSPSQIFIVNSSNIKLEGVELSNVSSGLQIVSSRNIQVINSSFSDNYHEGLAFIDAENITMENCTVSKNSLHGILISNGDRITISNSTINWSRYDGIYLVHSEGTEISGSSISESGRHGIQMQWSSMIDIISMRISDSGDHGITMTECMFCTIYDSVSIRSDQNGIAWYRSEFLSLDKNYLYDNTDGLYLWESPSNVITRNTFESNDRYGVFIGNDSMTNFVHHNSFLVNGNGSQAWANQDDSHWDDGSVGNHWSDYNGTDAETDGIGDTPQSIGGPDNETDEFPLMDINGSRSITVLVVDDDGGAWADYSSISAAIDNATVGAIIKVYSGTYYENVVIDKHLTLVGNCSSSTIIDCNGSGSPINISSNFVTVMNLQITGSDGKIWRYNWHAGVRNDGYWFLEISNCSLDNNSGAGLFINEGHFNRITDSDLSDNQIGVFSYSSHVGYYHNLTVKDNGDTGIEMWRSNWATFGDCIVLKNPDYGFKLRYSENFTMINGTVAFSDSGIHIINGSRSSIEQYTIGFNRIGVHIGDSDYFDFMNNQVHNNSHDGIILYSGHHEGGHTSYALVTYNDIQDNFAYGVNIGNGTFSCQVHHNNFIDNGQAVYCDSQANCDDRWGYSHHWDDGSEGNYWSDYSGSDSDHDGIGDTPYLIDGSANATDCYPLMDSVNTSAPEKIPEFDLIVPMMTAVVIIAVFKRRYL